MPALTHVCGGWVCVAAGYTRDGTPFFVPLDCCLPQPSGYTRFGVAYWAVADLVNHARYKSTSVRAVMYHAIHEDAKRCVVSSLPLVCRPSLLPARAVAATAGAGKPVRGDDSTSGGRQGQPAAREGSRQAALVKQTLRAVHETSTPRKVSNGSDSAAHVGAVAAGDVPMIEAPPHVAVEGQDFDQSIGATVVSDADDDGDDGNDGGSRGYASSVSSLATEVSGVDDDGADATGQVALLDAESDGPNDGQVSLAGSPPPLVGDQDLAANAGGGDGMGLGVVVGIPPILTARDGDVDDELRAFSHTPRGTTPSMMLSRWAASWRSPTGETEPGTDPHRLPRGGTPDLSGRGSGTGSGRGARQSTSAGGLRGSGSSRHVQQSVLEGVLESPMAAASPGSKAGDEHKATPAASGSQPATSKPPLHVGEHMTVSRTSMWDGRDQHGDGGSGGPEGVLFSGDNFASTSLGSMQPTAPPTPRRPPANSGAGGGGGDMTPRAARYRESDTQGVAPKPTRPTTPQLRRVEDITGVDVAVSLPSLAFGLCSRQKTLHAQLLLCAVSPPPANGGEPSTMSQRAPSADSARATPSARAAALRHVLTMCRSSRPVQLLVTASPPDVFTASPAAVSVLPRDLLGVDGFRGVIDAVGLVKRVVAAVSRQVSVTFNPAASEASSQALGEVVVRCVPSALATLGSDSEDEEATGAVLAAVKLSAFAGPVLRSRIVAPLWGTAGASEDAPGQALPASLASGQLTTPLGEVWVKPGQKFYPGLVVQNLSLETVTVAVAVDRYSQRGDHDDGDDDTLSALLRDESPFSVAQSSLVLQPRETRVIRVSFAPVRSQPAAYAALIRVEIEGVERVQLPISARCGAPVVVRAMTRSDKQSAASAGVDAGLWSEFVDAPTGMVSVVVDMRNESYSAVAEKLHGTLPDAVMVESDDSGSDEEDGVAPLTSFRIGGSGRSGGGGGGGGGGAVFSSFFSTHSRLLKSSHSLRGLLGSGSRHHSLHGSLHGGSLASLTGYSSRARQTVDVVPLPDPMQVEQVDFGIIPLRQCRSTMFVLDSLSDALRVVDFRCNAEQYRFHHQVVVPPRGTVLLRLTVSGEIRVNTDASSASLGRIAGGGEAKATDAREGEPLPGVADVVEVTPTFANIGSRVSVEYNLQTLTPMAFGLRAFIGSPLEIPVAHAVYVGSVPC